MVKHEFSTPWGICDLVGCSLNMNKVKQRLRLKQTKAIGSFLRAHLLSLIPDSKQSSITLDALHDHFGKYLDPERVEKVRNLQEKMKPVKVDRQGLFYIPNSLKEEAEIEREVIIIGMRTRLEIWSPTKRAETKRDRQA